MEFGVLIHLLFAFARNIWVLTMRIKQLWGAGRNPVCVDEGPIA